LPPPPQEVPYGPRGEAEGPAQFVGRRPLPVAAPQGLPDRQGDRGRHGASSVVGGTSKPKTARVCHGRRGGKRGLRDSRPNPPARDTDSAPATRLTYEL